MRVLSGGCHAEEETVRLKWVRRKPLAVDGGDTVPQTNDAFWTTHFKLQQVSCRLYIYGYIKYTCPHGCAECS